MLRRLNQLIVRISMSRWLFVLTSVIAFGSLFVLNRIGEAFPARAGGAQPFDLQNNLTPDAVFRQLAGYTPEAERLYYLFTAIDYVFPLAAGLFLAAAGAFALRRGLPRIYDTMVRRKLFPLFLIGSAFDWCENVAALTVIASYPNELSAAAALLVLAKRLKLAFVIGTQALVLLLLLYALLCWLRARRRAT